MKLGLINSAWAQAGRETAFGIRMTKEIGFDSIDIFADPLDIDVEGAEAHQGRVRPGRPADRQRRLRRRRPDRLQPERPAVPRRPGQAYLDMAYAVRGEERPARARRIHLAAGGDPAGRAVGDRRRARPDAGRVRRGPRPGDRPGAGAVPALAPQRRRRAWSGSSTTWTTRRCKANIDISHLVLAEQPAGAGRAAPRAGWPTSTSPTATARSTATCRRAAAWSTSRRTCEAIKGLGIDDATISIELEYSPEPDKIVDWVREAYEATAALMRAAGLRA